MKKLLYYMVILLVIVQPANSIKIDDNNSNRKVSISSTKDNTNCDFAEIKTDRTYSSLSEAVGNQEYFWILNLQTGGYNSMLATLLSAGEKCYVYMANETIDDIGEAIAKNRCNFYRDEFDALIYDKNVEIMGHPDGRFGDIDGDQNVTILVAPLGGAGGLYLQYDEIASFAYSNKREMIYIDSGIGSGEVAAMTIMHEFNHLIWFNNEMDECHFLLEGAAEFSVFYAGYLAAWGNLTGFTNSFEENHKRSLISIHEIDNIPLAEDYGGAYLFMLYLVEQYGIDILKALALALPDGPLGVDSALTAIGSNATFNEVFLNWITACAIDSEDYALGKYGFSNVDFTVEPDSIVNNYPYHQENVIHYTYGFDVKKLVNPPNEFTFSIKNPYPAHSLGISVAVRDQTGWYVTQTTHSENSELIVINVLGDEIIEAYIVTSLISENTPEFCMDFVNVGEETIYSLDFTIIEGLNQTSLVNVNLVGIIVSLILITYTTNNLSKKRKKQTRFHY